MEQPICPVEPGKRPEDEDLINHAMAIAIVEIKKALKDKVCVKTNVSTWREAHGYVQINVLGSKKEWDEYQIAFDKYQSDMVDYEAEKRGVSREHYLAARERLNEYNRKKCDKAAERDIEYYLASILEVPDDVIVAS